MKVNLPRGVSDTDFITADYPGDFPDKQQMQWDFTVPGMHNYTMHFVDHTAPECLNNEVEVEYQKEGKKVTKLTLTDPQPQHQQGNFNMVLKNCETNRTLQGLALNYRVSVMRSGHPGTVLKHEELGVVVGWLIPVLSPFPRSPTLVFLNRPKQANCSFTDTYN